MWRCSAVNSIVMSSASTVESATRQPWQRLEQESSKALAAFVVFRDLGPARTYEKVSRMLQKSEPLIARWGKRHNWHHRAADWDEFNDQEMQRELRSRRVRARKRALDIADELDQKLADALRSSAVIFFARTFPPIRPPSRPLSTKN